MPMPYPISELEIDAVSALPAPERYAHFLRRVVECDEVWSLRPAAGALSAATDPEGRTLVPVWPHPRYAEAGAVGPWVDAEPVPIPLAEWLDVWLPGIHHDGRAVTVFPLADVPGVVVEAVRLLADLDAALEPYG